MTYEKASKAISEIFGDTSVPKEETKASLERLREEIDIFLEALEQD